MYQSKHPDKDLTTGVADLRKFIFGTHLAELLPFSLEGSRIHIWMV